VRWETTGVCGPGGAENQGEEPEKQRVGQEEWPRMKRSVTVTTNLHIKETSSVSGLAPPATEETPPTRPHTVTSIHSHVVLEGVWRRAGKVSVILT